MNKIYFNTHCVKENEFDKTKEMIFEELRKDFKLEQTQDIKDLINIKFCYKQLIFVEKLDKCNNDLWKDIKFTLQSKYIAYFDIENTYNFDDLVCENKNIDNEDYTSFLILNKSKIEYIEDNIKSGNVNADTYLCYSVFKDFLIENQLNPIFEDSFCIYFKVSFDFDQFEKFINSKIGRKINYFYNLIYATDFSNILYKFKDVSIQEFLFRNFYLKKRFSRYNSSMIYLVKIRNYTIDSRYGNHEITLSFKNNCYNESLANRIVEYVKENPYIRSYAINIRFTSENEPRKIEKIKNVYGHEENSTNNIKNISLKENFNNSIIHVTKIEINSDNNIDICFKTDNFISFLSKESSCNTLIKAISNIPFVKEYFNVDAKEKINLDNSFFEIILSDKEIDEIESKNRQRIEKLKNEEREKELKRLERERKRKIKEICSKLNNILLQNYNIDESLNDEVLNNIINNINKY